MLVMGFEGNGASHMWCASARAHVRGLIGVSYLGNCWTDCAEIWCVVRDQLAMLSTLHGGGVRLHVLVCAPLSHISGTAGLIALKLGMLLETN